MNLFLQFLSLGLWCFTLQAEAMIHDAPIVVSARKIKAATRHPIAAYRLFKTLPGGATETIPFQIDEINAQGDYVLELGPQPNQNSGNGIFDSDDELSFMGNDVGSLDPPTKFEGPTPDKWFRITFRNRKSNEAGAVFLGIYGVAKPPPLNDRKYVVFSLNDQTITTSRYQYSFDSQNYLILREVRTNNLETQTRVPILKSSTFYMLADLKYFFTVEANHRSVNSRLEGYRSGPVRTIVRVDFVYRFLKLNFDVGMFTEVSFYSNSVELPAILYSPIDGEKTLNTGSHFYYGIALVDEPSSYKIDTNMMNFEAKPSMFNFSGPRLAPLYWLSLVRPDHTIYMEIQPSVNLQKRGVQPYFYSNNKKAADFQSISNNDMLPLGKSPVNIGVSFDLTKFPEGENFMSIKMYFENQGTAEQLEKFRHLSDWYFQTELMQGASPHGNKP